MPRPNSNKTNVHLEPVLYVRSIHSPSRTPTAVGTATLQPTTPMRPTYLQKDCPFSRRPFSIRSFCRRTRVSNSSSKSSSLSRADILVLHQSPPSRELHLIQGANRAIGANVPALSVFSDHLLERGQIVARVRLTDSDLNSVPADAEDSMANRNIRLSLAAAVFVPIDQNRRDDRCQVRLVSRQNAKPSARALCLNVGHVTIQDQLSGNGDSKSQRQTPDISILDFRFWILDFRPHVLSFGLPTPQFWILDFGFSILDCRLPISPVVLVFALAVLRDATMIASSSSPSLINGSSFCACTMPASTNSSIQ